VSWTGAAARRRHVTRPPVAGRSRRAVEWSVDAARGRAARGGRLGAGRLAAGRRAPPTRSAGATRPGHASQPGGRRAGRSLRRGRRGWPGPAARRVGASRTTAACRSGDRMVAPDLPADRRADRRMRAARAADPGRLPSAGPGLPPGELRFPPRPPLPLLPGGLSATPGLHRAPPALPSRVSSTATPWLASSSRNRSEAAKSRAARAASRAASSSSIAGSSSGVASGRTASTRSTSRSVSSARPASAVDEHPPLDPPVQVADEVEHGGQPGRHVQVVVEGGTERVPRGGQARRAATDRPAPAPRTPRARPPRRRADRAPRRSRERLVGVVEPRPVVDGDQGEPKGARGDARSEELADAGDVARSLGHL
jgi:hypothetical protein